MKKVLFFMLLLVIGFGAMAQQRTRTAEPLWTSVRNDGPGTFQIQLISSTENSVKVNVKVPGFYTTTVTTPQGEAYVITVPKSVSTAHAGEPDMPMTGIPVMIGDKARMSARVIDAQYVDYENIEVAPSKGDFPRSIDPATVPYTYGECYSQNAFFPASNVGLYEPYIIRDLRGQNIVVYPFAYNPVTKTLRVYYDMTVEMYKVDDHGTNVVETRRSNTVTLDPDFKSLYQRHFINYEAGMTKYTPVDDEGDLLIICYDNFISSMTDFVNWKKTRGINTTIVGTSTAGSSYSAIKSYIQSQYNANNNLTHVLLVGDVAQIPGYSYSGGGSSYSGLGDNAYGQIVGNDIYNDVFIGRFSASSTSQVQTQVARTINYERNLTTSDTWCQNGLGISTSEGSGGHNSEDDYQHIENLRTDLLNYGYTTVYQDYKDVSGYPTSTTTTISNHINSGVGIINYCNHGEQTGWQSHYYMNSNVNALTNNNKLPFIFSVACLVGKYDHSTDCFAETWMHATNSNTPTGAIGGAFSYISQPWVPPMWAQDEFVDILVESYNNNIKRTLAGAAVNGMMSMFNHYSTSDVSAVGTYQAWIIYGDPTLMMRTKTPQAMTVSHNGNITMGVPEYVVDVTNGNGAVATITDANHNILGKATVSNGTATISLNSTDLTVGSTLTLCVFGYNKVTYIGTINVVGGNQYDIVVTQPAHGTISAPERAYASAPVTLTATPETSYCLSSWDVRDASNNSLTVTNNRFTMPESDVTVTATFLQGLQVTLASVEHGSISADLLYALEGTTINLTATPAQNYEFVNWVVYKTGDPSTTVTVTGNSFTMPNYPVTVSANFVLLMTVEIGSGTTNNTYLPSYNYYKYGFSQQIYTPDEIGTAGTIKSIAFKNTGETKSRIYSIYLQQTDKETFSDNTDWVPVSSSSLAFSGELTFTSGEWTTITFSNPLYYDGSTNLLVTVADNTGSYSSSPHMACLVFDAVGQAHYAYTDNSAYSITSPGGSSSSGNAVLNVKNQIQLVVVPSDAAICARPKNFAASDVTPNAATLSWTESGEATNWVLQYGTNSDFTAGTYTEVSVSGNPTKALTDLTAEIQYYARVKAVCDAENASAWSSVCTFMPSNVTVIGSGSSNNQNLPTNNYYKYSLTQQIYTPAELGEAGSIQSVAFYKDNTVECNRNLDIYMVSTTKSSFSGGSDWISVSSANKVYSGTVSFADNAWTTITLNTPFEYDGTRNVAIIVDDNTGSYKSQTTFLTFNASNQAIRICSDGTNYNATSPSSYSGTVESSKNQIRVLIERETVCEAPTNLAAVELDHQSAMLNWNGEADSWKVAYKTSTASQYTEVTVTTNSYNLTGLQPETAYMVKVAAVCGSQTVWCDPINFTTLQMPCDAPTNLVASEVAAHSATLTWTANSETTEWVLQYGTNISFTTGSYAEVHVSGTPSANLVELTPETQYYARVKTVCSANNVSEWSNTCAFLPTYLVVIGSGTGTNSYLPTNVNNKYSLTQQIYTVAELGEAGNIVSIDFHKNNNEECARNLDIYMVSTDKGSFTGTNDWIPVTDANKVFSGTVNFVNNDWTTITLDVPFSYDGTRNIAIMVDDNSGRTVSATPFLAFPAGNQALRICGRTTNYRATTGSYTGTIESSKNQIRIMKVDYALICDAPADLTVSEIDHQGATVNWNGEADSWIVAYRPANAELFTEVNVNTTSYTLTGLDASTNYTVKVAAKCGNETVWGEDVNFTTLSVPCSAIVLDNNGTYTENFDQYTPSTVAATGVEPDCWEVINEDVALTEATMPQVYYNANFATSGSYTLRMKNRCVYAMPALSENIDLTALTMTFNLRQPKTVYRLQVGVINAEGEFEKVKEINNSGVEMEEVTVDFSGYNGNGHRIAFRNSVSKSSTLEYSINYIDDIVLSYNTLSCGMTLPYAENFDHVTSLTVAETGAQPDCWEVFTEDVALNDITMPQAYYNAAYATSGSYTLRMKNRCIYAMPALSPNVPVNGLTMTFNLRQPNSKYRLQVGVLNDENEFTLVKTFKCSGTSMQSFTVDFSNYTGTGHRIAFRNTLVPGTGMSTTYLDYSVNYIDDINIGYTEVGKIVANNDAVLGENELDVVVYPNPTKDVVNVQCTMNNAQCSGIEIVDVYGKIITTVGTRFIASADSPASAQSPVQINVSGLAAGMYFVRVTTDRGVVTKPFVKK